MTKDYTIEYHAVDQKWYLRKNNMIMRGFESEFAAQTWLHEFLNRTKWECDHTLKLSKSFYGVEENEFRCTKCLKTYGEINE